MKAILSGALGAIAIQPVIFAVWFLLPGALAPFPLASRWAVMLSLSALVIAAAFVLILGIPAFIALRRLNRASWGWVAIVGAAVAVLPFGIFTWPLQYHGYSSSGKWLGRYVTFYVDGTPTLYGWPSYLQGLLIFGIHGLFGGLIFLYLWRRQGDPNSRWSRP